MYHSYSLALGVVNTNLRCKSGITLIQESSEAVQSMMIGFMFEEVPGGIAACVLSYTTNLVAMLLVGFKAWCVHCVQFSPFSL